MSETTVELPESMARHFAWIERKWPGASITARTFGAYEVMVPGVRVEGYDAATTDVAFVVPLGFPFVVPEDFTTSPLRLANGTLPFYTTRSADDMRLVWLHQLRAWNPRRDSLMNYMGSILIRLGVLRVRDDDDRRRAPSSLPQSSEATDRAE